MASAACGALLNSVTTMFDVSHGDARRRLRVAGGELPKRASTGKASPVTSRVASQSAQGVIGSFGDMGAYLALQMMSDTTVRNKMPT